MCRGTASSSIAGLAGIMAALVVFGTASAQPGTVLSNQKISDTAGNFTAIIDNLDELGGAVAHLGDLDGPGPSVSALAIGAPLDDDGGTDRGAVYILFQDAAGMTLSHQKISETVNLPGAPLDNTDAFGSALAFLGDLDGPGPSVAALAIGSIGDDDGGGARGAVYIVFLSTSGTVLSLQKISNTAGNFTATLDNDDEFGGALASLGDLDGVGPSVHSLAVGVVGDDDGGTNRGAVYVLFLAASGSVSSHQKISSTQGNFAGPLDLGDSFGSAVSTLGDLDGGGPSVLALAASAVLDDDGGTDRGAVYVLFLNATGTVRSQQKISDTHGNFGGVFDNLDEFGSSIAHLGDLDGPGGTVATMLVGVSGDDDGGEDRGAVHILFVNADGACASSLKISDLAGNFPPPLDNLDGFGTAVAYLGDLDGPGPSTAALAVGAGGDDDGGTDRGAAYILFLDGVSVVGIAPTRGPTGVGALSRPWPNPFRPSSTIPYRLAEDAEVRIDVWDLRGRRVRRLFSGRVSAGEHQAVWDGRDDAGQALPTGTYFYRMTIDGRPAERSEKAVLVR